MQTMTNNQKLGQSNVKQAIARKSRKQPNEK